MFSALIKTGLAATVMTDINPALPGPYDIASSGPVGAVGNIYYFALGLGGLMAFIAITYAGIKWMLSRGNPSGISDAKDQITQALIGLVLLFGAYIVLNTINPELTVLNISELTKLPDSKGGLTPPGGNKYSCYTSDGIDKGKGNDGLECYATANCNGQCPTGALCDVDAFCAAALICPGSAGCPECSQPSPPPYCNPPSTPPPGPTTPPSGATTYDCFLGSCDPVTSPAVGSFSNPDCDFAC